MMEIPSQHIVEYRVRRSRGPGYDLMIMTRIIRTMGEYLAEVNVTG